MSSSHSKPNKLINETSLYLKQHAYNPVDWHPWNKEAFRKAKQEDKPIFLSIGYSTCHWCHVMAHESFEDKMVAHILNKGFVCIKVDREQRPDIDNIYMNICQMMTGSGGWPLTIIMTPDKKPFFAATYIPKETMFNRKGLLTLLPEIQEIWKTKSEEIQKSADTITKRLQDIKTISQNHNLTKKTLDNTYDHLFNSFDELYGGFGMQPKFPMPHQLLFLLRYWKRTKKKYALTMVETTLEHMRNGGIYDHIGFGFHRYATDRAWMVPHFEKMLYDQALLLMVYTEAYQITKKNMYKQTAEEIIEYVTRNMQSSEGGFYAAEDADSEGKEGKFYTWKEEELKQILDENEFDFVKKFFNVHKNGNFTQETGTSSHDTILYQSMNLHEFIQNNNMKYEEAVRLLQKIRKKLFTIRNKRIHPEKDTKIMCDWNGLMIAALAKAAQVFQNKSYAYNAEKAAAYIEEKLLKKDNQLMHIYSDNQAEIFAFADDYAFLIYALIELYQTTFHPGYLQKAISINDYFLDHFWDTENGGLFFTSDTHEKLIVRRQEIYDGAVPSANAVSMYNLIRLARLTGNNELEKKAIKIGNRFYNQIISMPAGYTQTMIGLDFTLGPSYEIVIIGKKDKKETQRILHQINQKYLPNKVIMLIDPSRKEEIIRKIAPFTQDFSQINKKPTIFICKNHQCQLPTTDIDEIHKLLT